MLKTLSRRVFLMVSAGAGLMAGARWAKSGHAPVSVAQGQLQGSVEDGIAVWKGIPYAAPPVGENRWQPPRPAAAWEGIRNSTNFGPACLQPVARNEPERGLKDNPQSEDCLFLNIWAPEGATNLPVMVWIHGGSFRFGTGALDLYHGDHLARQGVMVVTLNYRLGIFGTFAHTALGPAVNFGLLDQIAALEWVRNNIAAFGGDPDNVTLFGESAGGVSVGYLMSAEPAKGLFHKAIIQSGGLAVPLVGRSEGNQIGERLAAAMGAPQADAQTLRALPAEALRDAPYSAADVMPQLDELIRASAVDAFATGDSGLIPLMIGWNTAEAGFFGSKYWETIPEDLGPDTWEKLKALCTGWGRESDDTAAEQIASEWFAGADSRAMAMSHQGPVFAYRFGWVPEAERATSHGAIHTAEIPYVFGTIGPEEEPSSRSLSHEMMTLWTSFARNGQPLSKGVADWPSLNDSADNFLLMEPDGFEVGPDPNAGLDVAIRAQRLSPRP